MLASANTVMVALAIDALDVVISAGLVASAAMLVVAVFGQTGTIRLSPEREAAIATGHSDRKTIFEIPLIRPVLWVLVAMSHRLAIPRAKRWLDRTLVASGNPSMYTSEEYLALAILAGLLLVCLLETLFLLAGGGFSYMMVPLGLFAGIALALFQLWEKSRTRVRRIAKRLPYSLDLIALAMGAGATFTEAVRTITREDTDDPFIVELKTMLAEIDLGTTRAQALANMSRRVPLESLQNVIAGVVQSEQLGTPLSEVLGEQATLLRLHRSVHAENRAAIAGIRILLPCLLLVMAVIFAVFGPLVIRVMRKGLF